MSFQNINTYTANGDPVLSCTSGHSYSLWTTFVAPQTGSVELTATASNYNVAMAVYRTTATTAQQIRCVTTPETIPSSPTSATTNIKIVAGTRYYVMLAAAGVGSTVDSTSTVELVSITNAFIITPFQIPASGSYSNIQSDIENAAPYFMSIGACTDGTHAVSYSLKPSVSGTYEFSTAGSNYDTVLSLRQNGAEIACNENISVNNVNARLRPTLVAGRTYTIVISQSVNAVNPQTDDMVLSLRVRKL
jgi:hypothetical protein